MLPRRLTGNVCPEKPAGASKHLQFPEHCSLRAHLVFVDMLFVSLWRPLWLQLVTVTQQAERSVLSGSSVGVELQTQTSLKSFISVTIKRSVFCSDGDKTRRVWFVYCKQRHIVDMFVCFLSGGGRGQSEEDAADGVSHPQRDVQRRHRQTL